MITEYEVSERLSKKPLDILSRSVLETAPGLKEKIIQRLEKLKSHQADLPLVHFTSSIAGGESTGFTENIEQTGFEAKNTNVGAFVVREAKTRLATPDDLIHQPEEFVKDIVLFLKRYFHHGTRTNKERLGEAQNSDNAQPVVFLINPKGAKLEKGSDYDDHFKLVDNVAVDKIMGKIDLQKYRPVEQNYDKIITEILDLL